MISTARASILISQRALNYDTDRLGPCPFELVLLAGVSGAGASGTGANDVRVGMAGGEAGTQEDDSCRWVPRSSSKSS